MKCPYCNEEMVRGYIQCRDGVDWTEKKQVIAALSALGKIQTIMEDFEKYYGIRIIINNKKVLKYSYNGKFRQADGIDYALRVLQRDIHIKNEISNDEEIIYIN